MRILEANMEINKISFQPEMIVKIALPLELQNKTLTEEESYLLIGKSFMKAYEDYKNAPASYTHRPSREGR